MWQMCTELFPAVCETRLYSRWQLLPQCILGNLHPRRTPVSRVLFASSLLDPQGITDHGRRNIEDLDLKVHRVHAVSFLNMNLFHFYIFFFMI